MRLAYAGGSRFRIAFGAAGLAFVSLLAGCNAKETLLEATDPDVINPSDAQSAEGALALYRGGLSRLRQIAGGSGGEGSTWLFGGLLADEWSTSSTFVQNDETDERQTQLNNGTVTTMFRDLSRTRTSANQAIAGMKEFRPTELTRIGEMYFARGFAEMQMASDFCNGIPLSDGTGVDIVYGSPKPISDIFTIAIASLDSAIALATGADTASVSVTRAAKIVKARAQQGLGLIAEAAVTVAGIPTSYAYNQTYLAGSGDNTLWAQPNSSGRYTVGDSLEGNGRDLLVKNVIPFFSAKDPRLPVSYSVSANGKDTTKAQDGLTFVRKTTLYARTTPVAVVNGIDARMIEAEAALKAGNTTQWLSIHNALRAAPPKLGEVQPAVMTALTDPGTADARLNLHFREKAFWTFSRGQRLGDLRRLIRQYGRTPENTFPVGVHYRGGTYGADVNLPVPQAEQNNPNFTQCLDRKA
jgi:hypothetical protein